ncbi:hypothetical protein ACSSS7_005742 [Eimeria intestinalis]
MECSHACPANICDADACRHLEFFYLAHITWSFLVADMQARPFFVRLLDRALSAGSQQLTSFAGEETVSSGIVPFTPRRHRARETSFAAGTAAAAVTAADVDEHSSSNNSSSSRSRSSNKRSSRKDGTLFALPWRVQDAAWLVPAAQQHEADGAASTTPAAAPAPAGTATAAAPAVAAARHGAFPSDMFLSPLDLISYHKHSEAVALLQQVCRLLQLESPQVVRASTRANIFEVFAGPLIRWKADRRGDMQMFLREFTDSREGGGPPSPDPQWGHQWPLSEVSLWIEGVPLVLQTEAEGLLLHATSSSPNSQQRLYNTGFKYLLLRAFKALGQPKALFIDEDEWRAASGSQQQQQDLLRRKLGRL